MHLFGKGLVFVAVLLCCKAVKQAELSKRPLNIRTVFNISQRLWRYQQTESNVIINTETASDLKFVQECIFIKKINISETQFFFKEEVQLNGSKLSGYYLGEFVVKSQEPPVSMKVSELSGSDTSAFQRMKLVYSEMGCSIFKITYLNESNKEEEASGGQECEMYFRRKNGSDQPPQECKKAFKKKCKTEGHVIFKPSCARSKPN
uniref:Putative salivary lipocalin n=1 Tax=Amblyomma tuberculatum TaxID=48802 RepID=A0A6M2E4Y8_9ACAR